MTLSKRTSSKKKKTRELTSMRSAMIWAARTKTCPTWTTDSTKSNATIINKLTRVHLLTRC